MASSAEVVTKICTKCKTAKPSTEFYGNRAMAECKECNKLRKRMYGKTPAGRASDRRSNFRRTHGIELPVEYQLPPDDHRCPICETAKPGGAGGWHLDHCHQTGKLRGWLCMKCNVRTGHYEAPDRHLFEAYLELHDSAH